MSKKENNNNHNKKSNVIYIDKNRKAGTTSKKASTNSKSKTVKKVPVNKIKSSSEKGKIDVNKSKKKKPLNNKSKTSNSNEVKGNDNKIKKTSKSKKTHKKGRKLKWGRIMIAVILLLTVSFGCFKGIQILKNKNSKAPVSSTETIGNKNDSASKHNSSAKGQYDLDDEKNEHSKKYNIVVDAGHGGNDKGSLDSTDTIYEKDIALQIAKKVASRLGRESDVNVIMTRTEDKYVSLEERADIAKKINADALISIHLNAQKKNGDANGLETWYRGGATDGSQELAASVQKTTTSYVEINNRGIFRNNFEILRETTMPAVLVECGFITNVSDINKLKDPNYQDMLAEGIMQGTLSFLDAKNGKN